MLPTYNSAAMVIIGNKWKEDAAAENVGRRECTARLQHYIS